jgi:hypothetical protein
MPIKPVGATTPQQYIAMIDEPRRSEIQRLHDLIRQTVPTLEPHIHAGMIGYGTYRYRYASGREGEWFVIGLASQKRYISVYVSAAVDGQYVAEKNADRLAGASCGRSCIRFKHLSDIHLDVLADVIREGARHAGEGGFRA